MIDVPALDHEIIATIEAGAAGYLTDQSSVDDMVANLRALASGRSLCSQRITQLLFRRVARSAQCAQSHPSADKPSAHLTPRELQIVALIEKGLSNKCIAKRLCIELQTVKNHVHHVLVKLCLQRRTEVAHYVRQHGLCEAGTGTWQTMN